MTPDWAEQKPGMICKECQTLQQMYKDPGSDKVWYIERHTEKCSRYPNNLKLIDKANGNG